MKMSFLSFYDLLFQWLRWRITDVFLQDDVVLSKNNQQREFGSSIIMFIHF